MISFLFFLFFPWAMMTIFKLGRSTVKRPKLIEGCGGHDDGVEGGGGARRGARRGAKDRVRE